MTKSGSVIAPLSSHLVHSKSRRREPLPLQSMFCTRSPRTRYSTLRSSTDRALPLLTPVTATVSETSKFHHACSAERTDQVTYSGDQARVAVCNYDKRSHKVPPYCGGCRRRMHRSVSAGRRRVLGGGPLTGTAAPRFVFKRECNWVAKCFAGNETLSAPGKHRGAV